MYIATDRLSGLLTSVDRWKGCRKGMDRRIERLVCTQPLRDVFEEVTVYTQVKAKISYLKRRQEAAR